MPLERKTTPFRLLLTGASGSGKTASFLGLKNPANCLYLNADSVAASGVLKDEGILVLDIASNPLSLLDQVHEGALVPGYLSQMSERTDIDLIVLDSLTAMMEKYIQLYLPKNRAETMNFWADYGKFWADVSLQLEALNETKDIIIMAHSVDVPDPKNPIKITNEILGSGGLFKRDVRKTYHNIANAVKLTLAEAEKTVPDTTSQDPEAMRKKYPSVVIGEEEQELGEVYCLQVRNAHVHENYSISIRSPNPKTWSAKEAFINNDINILIDRLRGLTKSPKITGEK